MALCLGLPGWAHARRSIHPLHISHPLSASSIYHRSQSMASSLFNLHAWQSFCTTSLQVSLVYLFVWTLKPSASLGMIHKILILSRHDWLLVTSRQKSSMELLFNVRCLQCFETVDWVAGRAFSLWKIWSDEVLARLSVWSGVQMISMVQMTHCHTIISCFSKIQNGLSFCTSHRGQVVLDKRTLLLFSVKKGTISVTDTWLWPSVVEWRKCAHSININTKLKNDTMSNWFVRETECWCQITTLTQFFIWSSPVGHLQQKCKWNKLQYRNLHVCCIIAHKLSNF